MAMYSCNLNSQDVEAGESEVQAKLVLEVPSASLQDASALLSQRACLGPWAIHIVS